MIVIMRFQLLDDFDDENFDPRQGYGHDASTVIEVPMDVCLLITSCTVASTLRNTKSLRQGVDNIKTYCMYTFQ